MLITQDIDKYRNTEEVVVNEQPVPATPNRTETTAAYCVSAPAQAPGETVPAPSAPSSPCCGTGDDAEAAGSCCAPQAKREAVATGAGCCRPPEPAPPAPPTRPLYEDPGETP
ncbi:hypothetical protein ACFY15_15765 [Streptomyces sp. NPDC001373]|uniref:hypothetical protein n=1 Tax=Streptomyces sp. NPDC001373 TaxID=3364565 RepID=UPI00367FAA85